MRLSINRTFYVLTALYAMQLAVQPARAQTRSPALDEHPRIGKVRFEGVSSIKTRALSDSLVTQSTRCRGIILKPLCAISKSSAFVDKHYLERAEIPRDELRIRVIYFRAGYRQAKVTSVLTPVDEKIDVTFKIEEGPVTTVSQLNVKQTDTVLSARQVRRALLPNKGDPLNLAHIDSSKIRLRGSLWDMGYGDAIVADSMTIDAATHTAVLNIYVDPVHVTTIDTIVVNGNEGVSTRTVRNLMGLHENDLYKRVDMTAAQRRLYETELFRQTLVQVPESNDSAKTVTVTVREAPFRALRAGVGFNTTEFLQTEARFTRYNLIGGARRLDVRGAIGNLGARQLYGKSIFKGATPYGVDDVDDRFLNPTWEIGATVTEPIVFGAKASLGYGVSTHRRIIPGIVIDKGAGANASFSYRVKNAITASATYNYEQNRIEAGDLYFCINFGVCGLNTIAALRDRQRLSPFGISGFAERTDDALEPTRGYIARVDLEHASAVTLSDFRYNRAAAEFSAYMPRGRSVLSGHIRGGWVTPSKSTAEAVGLDVGNNSILHPRKRFYAGGARSVRGFGENQLGPRVLTIDPVKLLSPTDSSDIPVCTQSSIQDGSCDPNVALSREFVPRPLGGNTLLEGSVEFRFPFILGLRGAVFVDAGMVRGQRLNLPPGTRSAVTPGFGIRYNSPIGPVRVDLGIRPKLTEDVPVVTQYMDSDSTLHLVQLKTPKKYNPSEGSGGFLRGITSRMQLHLAIGEAW